MHIKEEKDINAYSVDAIDLFKSTLQYNIKKYNEFYSELQKRGHLKKDGASYKGQVKIILGDAFTYLKHSRQKYSLVFTSPPYGDNHTTVSYGQYSIMPLRWINYKDIDEAVDNCLSDGLSETSTRVQKIRQKTLNYLFTNKVSAKGEPYIEVAARLVEIFHQDEYNRAIAGRHSLIAEKARYYEKLCSAITEPIGNEKQLTSTLKEYRAIELYNEHVNQQHCEIATGDIFEIGSSYFLLVSQSCDTCLRSDGHRKLKFASLLEIQDNKETKYSYKLSCFLNMKKPVVLYHSLKTIPFEVLDLCVFNTNGQSSIVLNDLATFEKDLESYTQNYRLRFREVLEFVKTIQFNKKRLESFFAGEAGISAEDAKIAYNYLEDLDPNIKNFDTVEIAISFPVRRVARLRELIAIDIVKEYGIALSRIGHPFDFTGDDTGLE